MAQQLTYQWQRNGTNLPENMSKFAGVATTELKIMNAQNEDEDAFRCTVFNDTGHNITSNEAFLEVGKAELYYG